MDDTTKLAKTRIEACAKQAQMNATNHGGDASNAAMDLLCAFILVTSKAGANPNNAMAAAWNSAMQCTADFFPSDRPEPASNFSEYDHYGENNRPLSMPQPMESAGGPNE